MAASNIRVNNGVCYWCAGIINDQKKTGTTKKFCSVECRNKFHIQRNSFNKDQWPNCINEGCSNRVRSKSSDICNSCYRVVREKRAGICTVQKCTNLAVRVGHGLCETHYGRVRYTGSTELKPRVRLQTNKGYTMIKAEGHPLAQSNDWAFEHRVIAFEKYGPGLQHCHWCDKSLDWKRVVVDHLNEVKTDNRSDNLVTACTPCNRIRGAMVPFIRGLSEDRLKDLIATFGLMRTSQFECIEMS